MTIPFLDLKRLNQPYSDAIADALGRVAASGRYIGGPEVERFERELGAYNEREYVIGVSNGLDALRLIIEGYKQLGRLATGDEVIIPANTYIASILAVSAAGLVPVLVEPSPATLNLDSGLVERHINLRTKAIMPVHLYGRVAWDDQLREIARDYGLIVIEDNAQAIGAISPVAGLGGKFKAGALGDAAAFSFYPTKNLGTMGDAGAVATDDPDLAAAVKALANYGSDYRYHNIYCGFNCRMDPVQAAVLTAKLPGLDADNDRRREIAARYDAAIDHAVALTFPVDNPTATNRHQYVITVNNDRDEFRNRLLDKGVATDVHYAVPPHLQPCYTGTLGDSFPLTEKIARQIVSLPVAPYLSDSEVSYIIETVNTCL